MKRSINAFIRSTDKENRTVEFVISDGTKDRHRTVLNPNGWMLDNYTKNPIVVYEHNVYGSLFTDPNPDNIIGTSSVFMDGDKLIGRVTFEPEDINPLAEKIYKKVLNGTLRAASVGFAEVGKGKYGEGEEARGRSNETYYFAGQELLEWSVVNIPSNPAAVKRSGYSAPTLNDVFEKYEDLKKEYDEHELGSIDVVEFLKHMEGISTLTLKKCEKINLSIDVAERMLRLNNK